VYAIFFADLRAIMALLNTTIPRPVCKGKRISDGVVRLKTILLKTLAEETSRRRRPIKYHSSRYIRFDMSEGMFTTINVNV
jgi:hypothetical protein